MDMYEQPFYLTAVSHGREFERVLKDRKTFKVHSVFTHAVNLDPNHADQRLSLQTALRLSRIFDMGHHLNGCL
jgi:hypothetical protein